MPRGSGKFKTKRGGGRSFSRHLELDENGTAFAVNKWAARDKTIDEDDSDEEEEEDEEEEKEEEDSDSEEEVLGATGSSQAELTRTERKALKKSNQKKKAVVAGEEEEEEDDDEDLVNPNHLPSKSKKLSDLNAPQLSRREREAKEKQEAKERYWKLHLAGKTDQAKADLARLAKIRKEREEAQAKRKAETDAKQNELEAKATAQGRRR